MVVVVVIVGLDGSNHIVLTFFYFKIIYLKYKWMQIRSCRCPFKLKIINQLKSDILFV